MNVNINDITDRLIIRVGSVNEIPAQKAGETGLIQISTLSDYDRRIQEQEAQVRREREEAEARFWASPEGIARREREAREAQAQREREAREAAAISRNEHRELGSRKGLELEMVSLFYQWDHENKLVGFSLIPGTLIGGYYWSPTPYTSIGIEMGLGISYTNNKDLYLEYDNPLAIFFRVSPALGFMFPISKKLKTTVFSNFLLEMGYFGHWRGIITDWMTPAFDIGFRFGHPGRVNLNLRYRGVWYQDSYANSFTIGVIYAIFNRGNSWL